MLRALPYFRLEREGIGTDGRFAAVSVLHYVGHRSGKENALRVKIVYPRDFPRQIQRLYDHDRVLHVDPDGHLIGQHELCITLVEREEFTLGAADLTEYVVSATSVVAAFAGENGKRGLSQVSPYHHLIRPDQPAAPSPKQSFSASHGSRARLVNRERRRHATIASVCRVS